jgi:hypothetical protein
MVDQNGSLHMGFDGMDDKMRITMVLSNLKGEAEIWSQVKVEEVNNGTIASWASFEQEMEERFTDNMRKEKGQHDIHNFVQGKMSTDKYVDQFELLKQEAGLTDEESLYPLKKGISLAIQTRLYGSTTKVPDKYADFVQAVRAIGLGLDQMHTM